MAAYEEEKYLDISSSDDHHSGQNVFSSLQGRDIGDMDQQGNKYRDVVLHAGNLYRRVFVTARGYMGVAVEEIVVGDSVALVHGALVPFIVRDAEETSRYSLISDCYVHGLMSGEGFRGGSGDIGILTLV